MTINSVFFDSMGRLRSGWRFLIFILLFSLFVLPLAAAVNFILSTLPIGYQPNGLLMIVVNFGITLFLALGVGWLCGKLLEGLPFRALGAAFTGAWLKDLCLGMIIGGITLCGVVLAAVVFGGLSFRFDSDHGSSAIFLTLGVSLVVFVFGAAFEEAFCRGYIFQTFVRSGFAWPAIIFTSLLFASGHLRNPNVNWLALANTALAGVWFCVAYMKTRNLWLPFGMHLMWNWMQGSIFGIEVSGLKDISTAPLFLEIDRGPVWLTGGDYGIEGSITCSVVLIISIIAVYILPFLKPTGEMLALSSPATPISEPVPENS